MQIVYWPHLHITADGKVELKSSLVRPSVRTYCVGKNLHHTLRPVCCCKAKMLHVQVFKKLASILPSGVRFYPLRWSLPSWRFEVFKKLH